MMTEAEIIAKVESRPKFNTPAKGGPPPHRILIERYGNHASYVVDGQRVWGFDSEAGRNAFAADYKNHTVALSARAARRS